jgi:hypothetical protein
LTGGKRLSILKNLLIERTGGGRMRDLEHVLSILKRQDEDEDPYDGDLGDENDEDLDEDDEDDIFDDDEDLDDDEDEDYEEDEEETDGEGFDEDEN